MRVPVGKVFAVVDAADFELVSRYRWRLHRKGYAITTIRANGRRITLLMHKLILRTDLEVDHIHHDKLNNRRSNLREASHAQNCQNRRGANNNSRTGVRGVSPYRGRFRAQCRVAGRVLWFGDFATIKEAEEVVRAARARLMTHSAECQI
jgi:hypothetical protein